MAGDPRPSGLDLEETPGEGDKRNSERNPKGQPPKARASVFQCNNTMLVSLWKAVGNENNIAKLNMPQTQLLLGFAVGGCCWSS